MLYLIIALVLCVGLASAVVVVVALPARQDGREFLSTVSAGPADSPSLDGPDTPAADRPSQPA